MKCLLDLLDVSSTDLFSKTPENKKIKLISFDIKLKSFDDDGKKKLCPYSFHLLIIYRLLIYLQI